MSSFSSLEIKAGKGRVIPKPSERILKNHEVLKNTFPPALIESVPQLVFVLNQDAEMMLCNSVLRNYLGVEDQKELLGLRPGELLKCHNSFNPKGCTMGIPCKQCGALRAFSKALSGEVSNDECLLLAGYEGDLKAYNFSVSAVPITVESNTYCIAYLTDITDRKSKEVAERIFLHDLLNAVNGIIGASSLLKMSSFEFNSIELAEMIMDRANFMANEINSHRLFLQAEGRDLDIEIEKIDVKPMVNSLSVMFSGSDIALNKNVTVKTLIADIALETDKRLLYRILENLIKNALEASPENQSVTVEVTEKEGFAYFKVHNNSFIPENVKFHVFKRSFSTKGTGRGLGTYSIKLFTENYLKGEVWFETSPSDGTTFIAKYPLCFAE